MYKSLIVAVSAGLILPKKDYSIISRRNLYLNYGLLGLCSLLKEKGFDVVMLQGEYRSAEEILNEIISMGIDINKLRYPILLSAISFFSLDWCKDFIRFVNNTNAQVILGGKYIIENNYHWIRNYFKEYQVTIGTEKDFSFLNLGNLYILDYSLLHNYQNYNPSIEISRGCGHGCPFCADAKRPRFKNKETGIIVNEIKTLDKLYRYEPFNLYFQSSTFKVDRHWIECLITDFIALEHTFEWRCTTRVDALDIHSINTLSKAGLKVLDLGLESASIIQLMNMGKTSNPSAYLQLADEVIKSAYNSGILVKINILFAAGETLNTIKETHEWLDKRKRYIAGVSVNCETIFGPNNTLIEQYKNKYGSDYVNKNDLPAKGYANIHPSRKLSYQEALSSGIELSRFLMSQKNYFKLKKFGYFGRYYGYRDFLNDLRVSDTSLLPFKTKKEI